MKQSFQRALALILLLTCGLVALPAQSAGETAPPVLPEPSSTEASESTFLQDLRRGEIIFFGVLPFAFAISSISIDMYRWVTHDWNSGYAPLFGTVPRTTVENGVSLAIAGGISLIAALVDFFIVDAKRDRAARESAPSAPVIRRSPWPAGEAPPADEEASVASPATSVAGEATP
ncbi:MAG: hypothetical protein LBT11_06945 [Treponema sp.]|jgi:hypothetical protein|nr:hypothetical protein [Treponema sp.]